MPLVRGQISEDHDHLGYHPLKTLSTSSLVTIGDLHGNSLKLLYLLLKLGIVFWPDNEEKKPGELYQDFYRAYHITPPTKESLKTLKDLITKLHISDAEHRPHLRFLGDELADRGLNDLISLWIFDTLHQHGVQYDCCYSNHTHEFLGNYVRVLINQGSYSELNAAFQSFSWLYYCITANLIEKNVVIDLVENHKTHLRLMTYGLENTGIFQYTHAPTSYTIDQFLAQKLQLFYIANRPEFRAWSIEKINHAFGVLLSKNQNLTLFNREIIISLNNHNVLKEHEHPFEHIIWNRTYKDFLMRPPTHREYGYEQGSVHGHDLLDPDSNQNDIVCLDNLFGKVDSFQQCSSEIRNPILYNSQRILNQKEIEDVEFEIKAFIRDDIEQVVQKADGCVPHSTLMSKVKYYQQLLHDPDFSEVHQDIFNLINYTYGQINRSLLVTQRARLGVKALSEHISEIEERMSALKSHSNSLGILESLHQAWKKLLEDVERDQAYLQKEQVLFRKCYNKIKEEQLFSRYLKPVLEQLLALCTGTSLPLHISRAELEEKFNNALKKAFEEECRHIEERLFYQQYPFLASTLNELIMLGHTLGISEDKYQNLLHRIIENEERAARELIEKCSEYERYDEELRHLNADLVPANNAFVMQVRNAIANTLSHLNLPSSDYGEHLRIAREDHIASLRKLYKQEHNAIKDELTKGLSCKQLLSIQHRFLIFKKTIKTQETFTDLEDQISERIRTAEKNLVIRDKLQLLCTEYKSHLEARLVQRAEDPSIHEKIVIITGLEAHIKPDCDASQCIHDFSSEFERVNQAISARRSLLSVKLASQGRINKGVTFFSKYAHIQPSRGAEFVAEIKKVLANPDDSNEIQTATWPRQVNF